MSHTGAQQAICMDGFDEWYEALTGDMLSPEKRSKSLLPDIAKFIGTMTWVKQISGPTGVCSFEGETALENPPGEQFSEWVKTRKIAKEKKAEKNQKKQKTKDKEGGGGEENANNNDYRAKKNSTRG
jgi:hypothetical protein